MSQFNGVNGFTYCRCDVCGVTNQEDPDAVFCWFENSLEGKRDVCSRKCADSINYAHTTPVSQSAHADVKNNGREISNDERR